MADVYDGQRGLHVDDDTTEANARLIAAAPEMLEALRRAIGSRTLSIDYERNRTPEVLALRQSMIAAIAKATGEK